jgi:hypothetical protein
MAQLNRVKQLSHSDFTPWLQPGDVGAPKNLNRFNGFA